MGTDDDVRARILRIVQMVLLNERVGMEDNIFDAGGDSLRMLEICSEIETEFDTVIPLDLMWEASSISEFASVVEDCLAKAR